MAHIHRLIFAALVLLSFAPGAHAARRVVYTVTHSIGSPSYGGYGTWQEYFASSVSSQSGISSYCNNYARGPDILSAVSAELVSVDGNMATSRCTWLSSLPSPVCTPPQTLDALEANCVGAPVNNCPAAGTSAGRWSRPYIAGKGVSDAYMICDGATPSGASDGSLCVVSVVGDIGVGSPMVVYGEATYTGGKSANCTGDGGTSTTPGSGNATPPVQGEPAPTPCKAGYAPGSVNGITSCYPAGSTGKPVTTPSTTTTSTSVDGNSPTSSGTSQSVTCQLGQCTTTTTTTSTSSTGVTSSTSSTKTESQGDFCQSNPRAAQCVTSSFGSGACGTTPVCDGDAIQCAVAGFTFRTACALEPGTEPITANEDAYTAGLQKTGDQTTGASVNTTVNISGSSFDQTDAIGGASGLSDLTVTISGRPFTLAMSSLNYWFNLLGYLLVAVTGLICIKIVARGQ